jgi:hypothetical protein
MLAPVVIVFASGVPFNIRCLLMRMMVNVVAAAAVAYCLMGEGRRCC